MTIVEKKPHQYAAANWAHVFMSFLSIWRACSVGPNSNNNCDRLKVVLVVIMMEIPTPPQPHPASIVSDCPPHIAVELL